MNRIKKEKNKCKFRDKNYVMKKIEKDNEYILYFINAYIGFKRVEKVSKDFRSILYAFGIKIFIWS